MTGRGRGAGAAPTIADLVEVAAVETVVRLDGRPGRLAELVVTDDVAAVLSGVLGALEEGGAFFLVAHFGAGKSHLLAALAELCGPAADPAGSAASLTGWPPGLGAAAVAVGPGLAVAVPLVEHRAGAALEDVVLAAAYKVLGVPTPPAGTDRRATWDGLAAAATAAGRCGVVVLLDELSEFLRAKQPPALTEDLRFLQFLGEWCRGRPVVVVAALQESIDEVANVSQRELARIRDRYRTLTLSMRHVEDLVRGRLVHVRPGAEAMVERAHAELEAAFPGWGVPRDRFVGCYPVHPATLAVLEGLRFLFSQQRGVVDFVCRQLAGDAPAGIPPWQERPWLELLTPDRVYDHFAARLAERVETQRLAETVVPYWERAVDEVFDADADRHLALRTAKLLSLLAASPLERPRTAAELAQLLLTRLSTLDPAANVTYFESAVLDPMVARGAYVVAVPGGPGVAIRYSVAVEADAAVLAGARIRQARAELHPGDRRVTTTLVELGSSPALPLQLLAEVGQARRELLWHNTLRSLLVGPVRLSEFDGDDVGATLESARGVGAVGVLLVAEPEPGPPPARGDGRSRAESATERRGQPGSVGVSGGATRQMAEVRGWAAERAATLVAGTDRLAVWVPAPFSTEERELALELHARRLVLDAARAEGRTGAGDLVEFLERARAADEPRARELLSRVYFAGAIVYGEGAALPDLASLSGLPFDRILVALVDPLLSRLHPRHREVAPQGELIGERLLRQLVTEALVLTRVSGSAAERGPLRSLIAGYLAPLGLFRRQRDAFVLAPDPVRSPAVAEALRLVPGTDPVPATEVVAHLAAGPVGLTEPEALLVLNGCVQAGLLEAWRGRRRHTEPFLAVTVGDRLSAGELLDPAARAALAGLTPVVGTGPLEPWNAALQRLLWDRARAWLEVLREDWAQARSGLAALAEAGAVAAEPDGPADAGSGLRAEAVAGDVERLGALVEAVEAGLPAVAGLRALVAAVGDAEATLRSARRVAGLARFLREQLTRAEQSLAYLTNPRLELPADDTRLAALRNEAVRLGWQLLELAAEDRAGEFTAAERSFRSTYSAAYSAAHDRFYAAPAAGQADAVRASGPYRALAALAALEAVAVPDDRVKLDRALAAAVPAPCSRRLDLELAWKPRCGCGFAFGQEPPVLDPDAFVAQAQRGVDQYLAELARPEHRSRLRAAVDDLVALERHDVADDLRRLLALLTGENGGLPGEDSGSGGRAAGAGEPLALVELLTDPLATVVRDVLAGASLVVQRDLAVLREDLIGRRYPKRRLLELISHWVDAGGEIPAGGVVEVIDSAEAARRDTPTEDEDGLGPPAGPWSAPRAVGPAGATAAFCALRFPSLAALLPAERAGDAFWLAAWWVGRPVALDERRSPPPPWVPVGLLSDRPLLAAAADAATADLGARAELADLDDRINADSLLGDQLAAALDLPARNGPEIADVLAGERLLRHPLHLAAGELVRRLAGDPQLADRLPAIDPEAITAAHPLVAPAELAPLTHLLAAARHLGELERRLPTAGSRDLVEDIYPATASLVAERLSRAEVAAVAASLVPTDAVDALLRTARRLLDDAGAAFSTLADSGFPGCLRIWEVGRGVIAPLLRTHGRVAVLLVDAMRVDLWHHLRAALAEALPGRTIREAWAVVPEPTRTAEAVAALYLGRPVPAGSAPASPDELGLPFAHLGVEARALVGVDRDRAAEGVRELWASGPNLSVAVATGVDEALHRSTAALCELLDAAAGGLRRRVVPTLAALPASVPLVVTADHGFRERPSWGRGPGSRYGHGGRSLEECVVPVAVFEPADS